MEVGVDADFVSHGASLPRFLRPCESSQRSATHAGVPVHAVYTHKHPFGNAQVLWWPAGTRASDSDVVPRTILLFIPGNPGLVDFYVPFLNAIDRSVRADSTYSTSVTIFAHSHLGLSSYIRVGDQSSNSPFPETSSVALPAQIQAHVEFLDELLVAYGPPTRVLLVGHSIGCWFIQEILKARAAALRVRPRVGAYLLFPTISHIVRSPNGRKLSPFFRPPWPRVLANLSHLIKYVVPMPQRILAVLLRPTWPANQLQVLHDFLRAPGAIYASLTMAHDEMETVREPDADFLREFAHDLWFYYAGEDDWVGEQQRAVVLRVLRGTPAESHMVHGRAGVPHAFCINHSAEVASQCVEWMRTGGFLGDPRA